MEDFEFKDQNDGFYSHNKEDIIQDNVYSADYNGSQNGSGYYPPQRKVKPKKSHSTGVVVLCAFLAAVIGAVSGLLGAILYFRTADNTKTVIQNGNAQNVTISVNESTESVAQAVAKKAKASVVGIRTTTSVINFFGGSTERPGEGSGVVYSADGYIITNYHVVEDAVESRNNSKIEVFLDGDSSNSLPATVVGYNISNDIAVLKVNAVGLTPAEIGDSSKLTVGQYVVTIGSPGGLEFMGSVTYGVISGLDRVVSSNSNVKLIQTDAAINPGNSGGALLDSKGRLIGINSSKIVAEEYEGMGFSIPINTVLEKVKRIIDKQNSPEAYVGITLSSRYTGNVLQSLGYPAGAVVLSVDEGSPAYEAGIRRGDIITEFAGKEIGEYTEFNDVLSDSDVGQSVSIKIYRSGEYYTSKITIGSNS